MLVEEVRMSRSIMQRNYSHCPLKKRPVPLSAREEHHMLTTSSYHDMDDNSEPENLSTKPEDLSRTGNYPSKASSPAVGAAPAPRRWQEPSRTPPLPSPYSHHYPMHHQQITTHLPMQPMQPHIPAPLSPYLPTHMPAHMPAHMPTHMPSHLPTHLPTHLAPYPSRPTPLEPLNLNTPVEQYCSWQRPTTPYGYVGYSHPEVYSGLSPRAACSPPVRSPLIISPASPSISSIASPPTSPPVTRSEDIISPGSVSSDSGISAGSVPRRRRDASTTRYQCPDCGKSYSTYSGLSKHRQFHCAAAEGNLAKKSFSCKYCSKVYTSLGALKMHIRTHTLPCKCHLCGKAFSRPWLLQGHIRTHTGEKPFSCHHCRRAFADRSNLRAHLQTHSEVKKYSCASCSKTFSRMSLLSKHLEGGCPGYGPASSPYEYHPEELAAY